MNFTKPQLRALALLELNEFTRSPDGWVTLDGTFVALPTMKSLRRHGLAIRTRDLLTCRITDKGRLAVPRE